MPDQVDTAAHLRDLAEGDWSLCPSVRDPMVRAADELDALRAFIMDGDALHAHILRHGLISQANRLHLAGADQLRQERDDARAELDTLRREKAAAEQRAQRAAAAEAQLARVRDELEAALIWHREHERHPETPKVWRAEHMRQINRLDAALATPAPAVAEARGAVVEAERTVNGVPHAD